MSSLAVHDQPKILFEEFLSPLGPIGIAASDEGLCFLNFTDQSEIGSAYKQLEKNLPPNVYLGNIDYTVMAKEQLTEYFAGQRKQFTVPLAYYGTLFQKRIWQSLMSIPYGETRSYREQAIAINQPSAVRAVANANGQNLICIITPCHRVIGSDGSLTGYSAGLSRKEWLLNHESINLSK